MAITIATLQTELDSIRTSFQSSFPDDPSEQDPSSSSSDAEPTFEKQKQVLLSTLKSLLTLAERADASGLPREQLEEQVLEKAAGFEAELIGIAYDGERAGAVMGEGTYDFLPEYHANVVKTEDAGSALPGGKQTIVKFMSMMSRFMDPNIDPQEKLKEYIAANPAVSDWTDSTLPDAVRPHASPLARFERSHSFSSFSAPTPHGQALYEARCDVYNSQIANPVSLKLQGSLMGCIGVAGWKERDPVLEVFTVDDRGDLDSVCTTPGLSSTAYALEVDEGRKLFWVTDGDRIKSYELVSAGAESALCPTHTLSCDRSGPIALLDGGNRVAQAANDTVYFWNDVDGLRTHGDDGGDIVGEEMDPEHLDSWRDNDTGDEIELSAGLGHSATLKLSPSIHDIALWHPHPSSPSSRLCAASEGAFRFFDLDLTTGQPRGVYLGHGGDVNEIATLEGEERLCATTAGDGVARVWDVRRATPVFGMLAMEEANDCCVMIREGGDTLIAVGGSRNECVRLWSLKAQKPLYKLSVGNNVPHGLAWHSASQTLFAATECSSRDRLGGLHDYRAYKAPVRERKERRERERREREEERKRLKEYRRKAEEEGKGKKRKRQDSAAEDKKPGEEDLDDDEESGNGDFSEEDEDDLDEDDDDDFEDRGWPERAFHDEGAFGASVDAAEHSLWRYHFKLDASKQVPLSGDSYPTRDGGSGFGFGF